MKVRRIDRITSYFPSLTKALLDSSPTTRAAEIVDVLDGELLAYADNGERSKWVVTRIGKKRIADEVNVRNGYAA